MDLVALKIALSFISVYYFFCNVNVSTLGPVEIATFTMSNRGSDEEKSDVKEKSIKKSAKAMRAVVRQLENSLADSERNDKQLILTLQNDRIKNQKLNNQLEEARKENKQLLSELPPKLLF